MSYRPICTRFKRHVFELIVSAKSSLVPECCEPGEGLGLCLSNEMKYEKTSTPE